LDRIQEANTHPPVIRKRQIVGLLFADDLAVRATTIGLQRAINCIKDRDVGMKNGDWEERK
jgi:hypothetical protein